MINNVLNLVLLVGFLISIVYGVLMIIKNKETKLIFSVSLISMIAFFISRLFFIVLEFSNGDVNGFSVGVLGQVAGFLFLVLANKTYLPFETSSHGFNFKAALILLLPLAVYGYSFMIVNTVGEIVCSILYLCSTSLALYYSFKNILQTKVDANYKNLKAYFVCVMTITITSTFENIIFLIENTSVFTIVCITLTIIAFVDSILMLPLLHRGLQK